MDKSNAKHHLLQLLNKPDNMLQLNTNISETIYSTQFVPNGSGDDFSALSLFQLGLSPKVKGGLKPITGAPPVINFSIMEEYKRDQKLCTDKDAKDAYMVTLTCPGDDHSVLSATFKNGELVYGTIFCPNLAIPLGLNQLHHP
jgi:hypothetical protein